MGRTKGAKNKNKKKSTKLKKRGRPVGSKNKNKKKSTKLKKRGRPVGSKNKKASSKANKKPPKAKKIKVDMTNVKRAKFFGYCPKCKGLITSLDFISKMIFVCPGCDKRTTKGRLKKINKNIAKPKSKKEFLETTLQSGYHDMPALDEKPLDLKIESV